MSLETSGDVAVCEHPASSPAAIMASTAGHLVNVVVFKSLYLGSASQMHVGGRVETRENRGGGLQGGAGFAVVPASCAHPAASGLVALTARPRPPACITK